jgi:hypothetical protein
MHDLLPEPPAMRALVAEAGFDIDTFIAEEHFYCVLARRRR